MIKRTTPACAVMLAIAMLPDVDARTFQELPEPIFVDTEVSTNVAIRAWGENTRQFTVSLQFDATPSNNVQEAFGMDDPGDGNLSAEEIGMTLGWDCGEWFIASDAVSNRFAATPAGTETRKELSFRMSLGADGLPRALELTDGSSPLAFAGLNLSPAPPVWMYSKDWNLLKVVARGTDEQNEQISVKLSNDAVTPMLR